MSSVSIQGNASGTGIFTIASPNSNTNRTLTLPDSTGTVVVTGGAQTIEFAAGSASTPSITTTGDTNTGIFFPAADTIAFTEGGAESMRINSNGDLLVGASTSDLTSRIMCIGSGGFAVQNAGTTGTYLQVIPGAANGTVGIVADARSGNYPPLTFTVGGSERARITSGGLFNMGPSSGSGITPNNASGAGYNGVTAGQSSLALDVGISANTVALFNRCQNDGTILDFRQDATSEGTISVSGTTVSYNGGNLSRWAQMPGTKDDTLVKGTVMSNLDEMNVYTKDGEPVDNEQLNKVKVSDVEGDVNVAGVFVNWTYDDAHQVDEINMAMTGDMIIRIAQGVVVQKGDLLMSAGDGTAKPQGDDIVRSKTVAKVTSNHVTCTYADGSYCVPCVLMAC
jgi:hypothetical protein